MTARISRRLLKDIDAVQAPSLKAQGLFYCFEESNLQKGRALLLGHDQTPYEGLLGLFDFTFPTDYPFAPPQVEWKTWDGKTRFHPQLYVGGKVCLSVLGTWSGPGWSSMMNLESILQILQSLFVENPLACEPGYEKGSLDDSNYRNYKDYVEHQVIQYMFQMILSWQRKREGHLWEPFEEEIELLLPGVFEKLKRKVLTHSTEQTYPFLSFGCSGGTSNWLTLRSMVPKIETGFLST